MATPPEMLTAGRTTKPMESVIPGPDRLAILPTDGELLMLFVNESDEAAFTELIERHGPMVWRVCRGILLKQQDAEDAFQATFLLLASKAKQVRSDDSAAGWLYRVAYRTALSTKRRSRRRREEQLESEPVGKAEEAFPDLMGRQMVAILLEELRSIPEKYQTPLVMRYLEGQSRRKIADQTGTTVASVQGMLARGKQILRSRLIRRGVSLSVAMGLVSAAHKTAFAAPPRLITQTTASCQALATTGTITATTATAATLFREGTRSMFLASMTKPMTAVAACSIALALWLGSPAIGGALTELPTEESVAQFVIDNSVIETPEGAVLEPKFVLEAAADLSESSANWEEQSWQSEQSIDAPTYTVQNKPELSINELNQRGWRSFYQGKNQEAEADFREILERDWKHLPALNGLAFALLNQGNVKEAKPLFEKYLKKDPKASGPLNGLARCLAAEGDADGAIKLWEKGAKLTPGASAHTSSLAFTYFERGEYAKAIPHFELLVKSAPGNAQFSDGLQKAKSALAKQGGKADQPTGEIPRIIERGDDKPDGKKSLGGSGHLVKFTLPSGVSKIRAIRLHASRYGARQAPREDFEISFLSEDRSEIIAVEHAAYGLFRRGNEKWTTVRFDNPIELPKTFWVALDFNPGQTKGIYLSYDTETGGSESMVGLAQDEPTEHKPVDFGGDWMVGLLPVRE